VLQGTRSWGRRSVLVLLAGFAGLAGPRDAARATCADDCDVSESELVIGVDIALGQSATTTCEVIDRNRDGMVSIDELLAAVNAAVVGCPPMPTPTPTSPPTVTSTTALPATLTATFTPSPTGTLTTTPSLTPTTAATPSVTPTPVPLTPIAAGQVHEVLQSLSAALLSITGTSAADVYTVGADANDGTGPMVLHYTGQTWQRLNTGLTSGGLWWIDVTPIDGAFYMAGECGLILRYDPVSGAFQAQTIPGNPVLFGIWGSDSNNIWTVGGDLTNPDTGGGVWHFDGSSWSNDTTILNARPQGLPILFKVWGRSASDLYVVGRLSVVFHFDGMNWTPVNVDLGGGDPADYSLFTVNGNATQVVASGGFLNGVVLELINSTFENRALPGLPVMNGVFIRSDGSGAAVGNGASVALRVTEGWQLQQTLLNTALGLHGTWIDPDGGLWAVGGNLGTLGDGMLVYGGSATIGTTIVPAP